MHMYTESTVQLKLLQHCYLAIPEYKFLEIANLLIYIICLSSDCMRQIYQIYHHFTKFLHFFQSLLRVSAHPTL